MAKLAYQRKTKDEFRLLIDYHYGNGWEHETTEFTRKEARTREKEYHSNYPKCRTKVVKKRIKIEENPQ
jgi:hypothetical protein